ncbi:MAG TPA: hypothetical protein VFN94_05840 [Nitrospiria bacterium]|nr:hypothetical protein [Nitrospiria bacterium]
MVLFGSWALRSLSACAFRVEPGTTEHAGAVTTIRGASTWHAGQGCGSWYWTMGLKAENTPHPAQSYS